MTITASIVGPTFVTIMMDGTTHTIQNDHANYAAIREALKAKDHVLVEKLVNVAKSIETFVSGKVAVKGDKVFYGEFEVKGSIVHRIISMLREGFDAQPMILFLENLMQNPSKRAVDELYGFLEATALPITDDGCFLAYKKVNNNYMDFYSGTMDNSIGKVLEMPRNQVNDNKDETCSYGLHFCSLSYLPAYHGGDGRVVIVKINPRDVVSIPSDYNNAKGRTCRYEVVGEHEGHEQVEAFTAPVYTASSGSVNPVSSRSEYQLGYDAGVSGAELDMDNEHMYDETCPGGHSADYCAGYVEGYRDTYDNDDAIDYSDVGYERGSSDADANKPYDDTPPSNADAEEYRTGYADGWRDAKLDRI